MEHNDAMKKIFFWFAIIGLMTVSTHAMAGAGAERMHEDHRRAQAAKRLNSADPERVSEAAIDWAIGVEDEARAHSFYRTARVETPGLKGLALGEVAANGHKWTGFEDKSKSDDPETADHAKLHAFLSSNPNRLTQVMLGEIAANPDKWRGVWDGEETNHAFPKSRAARPDNDH